MKTKYTKEVLQSAIDKSLSMSECIKSLNLKCLFFYFYSSYAYVTSIWQ